ncbi:hypothetical protein KK425_19645 [Clostridioides difficile]|nr:hypothetical protein [Clostridioides difficile]
MSEYIIVIDEIHQTYTDAFRSKAIKSLNNITNKCRGRLDITATPSKLEFEIYNKVIEYKQNIQTEYKVKLYDKINIGKVIEILNNSNNSMLLKDSISTLNYISKKVNKRVELLFQILKTLANYMIELLVTPIWKAMRCF